MLVVNGQSRSSSAQETHRDVKIISAHINRANTGDSERKKLRLETDESI